MNYRQMAVFLMICGLQILVGNWVGAKGYASGAAAAAFVESIPGLLVLLAIIVGGVAVAHFIPWKGLPAVAYIVTLGCIVTIPGFPGSEMLTAYPRGRQGHRRAQVAGLEDSRRRPLRLRRNLHRLRDNRGNRAAHDELAPRTIFYDKPVKFKAARDGAAFFVSEVVVRPHADDFDCHYLFQNLIDEPVLYVDAARKSAL